MKRLLVLMSTFALVFSLTAPAWAQETSQTPEASKTEKKKGEMGKPHLHHGKKKGAMEGKKEGQEGTTPSEAPKQ